MKARIDRWLSSLRGGATLAVSRTADKLFTPIAKHDTMENQQKIGVILVIVFLVFCLIMTALEAA